MTRAHDQVGIRLAALADALEQGGSTLPVEAAGAAQALVARAGERLALSADHTVVALAGATGSGKSSLFNALTGMELARVGIRRPTTDTAQACVWGADGAQPLLEWLGVGSRDAVAHESVLDPGSADDLRGLVLLDLPDHDSTASAHRLVVDRLVAQVDLLVWVVDPQKYADAALHENYLRRLSAHDAVLLVVLNQTDRLAPGDLAACRGDLLRLLRDDGLLRPKLLVTSAVTGAGLDDLRSAVREAVRAREARVRRLQADLDRIAPVLLADVDGSPGTVHRRDHAALVDALSGAAGVPGVVAAVDGSVRRRAVAATGWPVTRWASRLRPDPLRRLGLGSDRTSAGAVGRSSVPVPSPVLRAQVDVAVRRLADAAAGKLPVRWSDSIRAAARGRSSDLGDALDTAVVGVDLGAERSAWWWPVLGALQWLLVAVAAVGLGWLLVLAVGSFLGFSVAGTPSWHGVAWPTVLLAGGVIAGLAVAGLGRLLAGAGARHRAARARSRLRKAVERVADERVVAPVERELARWHAVRAALVRACGR